MSRTVSTGQKGSKTTYNCPKLSAAVILRLQVAPWGDYLKYGDLYEQWVTEILTTYKIIRLQF